MIRLSLILCLTLGACSNESGLTNTFDRRLKAERRAAQERRADARAVDAGFAPTQPAPIEVANVEAPETPAPGAILPAASEQYRYIGRWAPDAAGCAADAWKFETRRFSAGRRACDLPVVTAVPNGYELQGTCKGAGRDRADTLKLRFDDRHRRLRVASRTTGTADLLYCGP